MEDGSTTATSPEAKANLLARFFASQCSAPHSSDTLPPGAPYPRRSADETYIGYNLHPVTDREVLNSLSKLSPSKSPGRPLLTNRVLREVAPSISQSLTISSIFDLPARLENRCRCSPVQAERRCQRTNKLPSGVTFTSSRKGPGCNPKQKGSPHSW